MTFTQTHIHTQAFVLDDFTQLQVNLHAKGVQPKL